MPRVHLVSSVTRRLHRALAVLSLAAFALVPSAFVSPAFAARPDEGGMLARLQALGSRVEPEMAWGLAGEPTRPKRLPAPGQPRRRIVLEAPTITPQAEPEARPGVPYQIGVAREVPGLRSSTEMHAALVWEALPSGDQLARLAIVSPEAHGLRAGLRIFSLPREARIRTYASGAAEAQETPGGSVLDLLRANRDAGDIGEAAHTWWSPVVAGPEVVVEIEIPAGTDPNEVQVALPTISHLFASPETVAQIGSSATCNVDASCHSSTWGNVGRATAHMVYSSGGSSYICTGTLLNDRDTSTQIPYFLSAHHCISTQTEASTLETYWFFTSTACNSGTLNPGYQRLSGGATLLYAAAATDTSFMRLNANPPAGALFAGWLPSLPSLGSAVTAVHHPHGDLQKISFGSVTTYEQCVAVPGSGAFNCTPATASSGDFVKITFSSGTTEGGSSGSGLFLDNGQYLIGQLYGGTSGCGPAAPKYYGRFDQAYVRALSRYLDNATASSYTLTVGTSGTGTGTVTGTGINCGADCSESYASGTSVTLTATPGANTTFAGWQGACTNTSGPCTVSMTSAQSVMANFTANMGMTLKDAIYFYNKPVYSNAYKVVVGYHCDVLQLVLDVKTGFTDLTMVANDAVPYPDRIMSDAAMFAYSLYGDQELNGFALQDNTVGVPDSQVGAATFFTYCFTAKSDAFVFMYDDMTHTCTKSDGSVIDCSGAAAALPATASQGLARPGVFPKPRVTPVLPAVLPGTVSAPGLP